ncbi:AraC family transcriptional regulator [Phenylobacterium sp.]|uniref:helix-turn-helix domain-containing protein n=1 Tax=Phenylobacterium sp. TaxID=1871053 RepID=UPI00120DF6FF|nr:AraC family transcriptional regulator [Phenylobacterium sp.]THD62119.1 MAG: AraC family transcriptional regulator [Phenylobacterium sp.]
MSLVAQSQFERPASAAGAPIDWPISGTAVDASGSRLVTLERRDWTTTRAAHRVLRSDGGLNLDLRSEQPQLFIVLEAVGAPIVVKAQQGGASSARRPGPHISLIPGQTVATAASESSTYLREITIQFDMTGDPRWGTGLDPCAAMTPRLMFFDQRVMRLGELLADECAVGEGADTLYGDSLGLALRQALARLGQSAANPLARGGLAPWQLKRVIDYMEANLSAGVRLEALAELADFSLSHFSRAFKASTGLAPHRWLLDARLREARNLLLNTEVSLAEIALDTGFVDQPHFTRAFTSAMGEPPGAWRKMRCDTRSHAALAPRPCRSWDEAPSTRRAAA